MDDVVQAFQKLTPGVSVGLITLPPGLIADAILAGGWRYEGKDYPGRPDVYASVNLGHLQKLRQAGLMGHGDDGYIVTSSGAICFRSMPASRCSKTRSTTYSTCAVSSVTETSCGRSSGAES
jgi:hypothetical protein